MGLFNYCQCVVNVYRGLLRSVYYSGADTLSTSPVKQSERFLIDPVDVILAGPIVKPQCTLYRWMIDRLLYFLRRV